jgi:hypothetical protein
MFIFFRLNKRSLKLNSKLPPIVTGGFVIYLKYNIYINDNENHFQL